MLWTTENRGNYLKVLNNMHKNRQCMSEHFSDTKSSWLLNSTGLLFDNRNRLSNSQRDTDIMFQQCLRWLVVDGDNMSLCLVLDASDSGLHWLPLPECETAVSACESDFFSTPGSRCTFFRRLLHNSWQSWSFGKLHVNSQSRLPCTKLRNSFNKQQD